MHLEVTNFFHRVLSVIFNEYIERMGSGGFNYILQLMMDLKWMAHSLKLKKYSDELSERRVDFQYN
jgi:hypothetical protein